MSAFVDISDISIHATRRVVQTSYAQLDHVLDNEQGVEGFFEYHDDWEDDCDADDFEYEVEVEGVISGSQWKKDTDSLNQQIKTLLEENVKLKDKVNKNNRIIDEFISLDPLSDGHGKVLKDFQRKVKEGQE